MRTKLVFLPKAVATHFIAVVFGLGLAFLISFIVSRYRFHQEVGQLQSQIQQFPKDVDNWTSLGYTYSLARYDSEAITAFKKALELDPSSFQAYIGMGTVYDREGNYAAAQTWYSGAVSIAQKGRNSLDILMAKEALKLAQARKAGGQGSPEN